MNIKKIVLASLLLVSINTQMHAVGEIGSVAIGVVFGPAYEYLICHTPYWASIPAVPGTAIVQLLVFCVARTFYSNKTAGWPQKKIKADTRNNFKLSLGTALASALVTYGIDSYLSEQKKNKSNKNVAVEAKK